MYVHFAHIEKFNGIANFDSLIQLTLKAIYRPGRDEILINEFIHTSIVFLVQKNNPKKLEIKK